MLIETRSMWRLSLMAVLVEIGCTSPNPRSCLDDFCEDPNLPFCDSDGAVSGEPGTCVAVTCEPLAFEACRGDEALICNSTGDDFNVTACPNGCDAAEGGCLACAPGSNDCAPRIIPHFLPVACNTLSLLPPFEISTTVEIDTSDDATCTGGIVEQGNGLPVCMVQSPTIKVAAGATIRVRGTRALALIADTDVIIDGVVDVSGDVNVPGPGGNNRGSGNGFGGAGFATTGGHDSTGSGGGAAIEDPALGDQLVAGATAGISTGSALGGGGGGAVAMIGCRGRVSVKGTIDANGGGGYGGRCFKFCGAPNHVDVAGSGGGSGGYVVIQATQVEITGKIFANGGGGGAGQQSNEMNGQSGGDGLLSAVWANNGGAAQNGGGAGGAGGHSTVPPDGGTSATITGATAGGGGGSIGMIQIFTPANVPPSTTGASVSPDFRPHRNVETK